MWVERNGRGITGEPPCETCRVDLLPSNSEAANIYFKCRRQIITFFNGEVDKELDLNYVALDVIMDIYGIRDKKECFEKVIRVYHHFLKERDTSSARED